MSFFKELEEFLKTLKEMEEKGETKRVGSGRKKGKRFSVDYNYSINIGLGNEGKKKKNLPFHKKPSEVQMDVDEEMLDVFEEDKDIRVVAELPGVKEDEIDLELTGHELLVKVDADTKTKEEEIRKKISLSEKEFEEIEIKDVTLKNNVLEIVLRRKDNE